MRIEAPRAVPAARARRRHARRSWRPCAAAGLSIVLSSVVAPAAAKSGDEAWFLQGGEGDRAVRSAAIGYTRGFLPKDDADPTGWSVYGEAVLGEWFVHHHDPGQRTMFTQVTAAPVLRYTFDGALRDVFIEAGVGLTAIVPRFHDTGRAFSTTFQFDDHASLGLRFGARDENELSIRIEHFSNGGLRNPNPGQNFGQLRFARHF